MLKTNGFAQAFNLTTAALPTGQPKRDLRTEMATPIRTATQIAKAYNRVRKTKELTQAKLDRLLEGNALYKLFEQENTDHPYYALARIGAGPLDEIEFLIAGVLGWTVGKGTIRNALEKLRSMPIATELAKESDWDALLQIAPVEMSETEVADKLQSLFGSSTHVFDSGKQKELDIKIAALHGRKNVQRHRESPPIELVSVLRPAVNEVKKLAKVLRDCGNGVSTVRRELEKKQMIRGLSGQAKDHWIDAVLR